MKYQSREMWYRDYMRMIDEEYEDYGFTYDSEPYDDEYDEADYDEMFPGEDDDSEGNLWYKYSLRDLDCIDMKMMMPDESDEIDFEYRFERRGDTDVLSYYYDRLTSCFAGSHRQESYDEDVDPYEYGIEENKDYDEYDDILTIPDRFLRLKDIELPDDVTEQGRKLKRDLRMEALRRIEQSARTVADFRKLNMWYDTLDDNEWRRQHSHEIVRSGDEFPIEYGEKHCGAVFPGYMSGVISWQMRKGDFLDAIYCKPDTIDELVTTDYIIHFMRALDEDEKKLFYFKVLESLSSGEIAEMKGQTDRAVRKTWNQMITHIRQKTMGVLIFRSDKDYSFTGQEKKFLDTCWEKYEYRIEP